MRVRGRARYPDRAAAGRGLAVELARFAGRADVVVLALPRGGVPVAAPVAAALTAPLGVVVVRKVGAPGHSELAMGALAWVGGRLEVVRNEHVVARLGVSATRFDEAVTRESRTLAALVQASGDPPAELEDKVLIVVDDGLATGSTMLAAATALRRRQPAEIVVAVPVGAQQACDLLAPVVDSISCPWIPDPFVAVALAYEDFAQVADAEVAALLENADRRKALPPQ